MPENQQDSVKDNSKAKTWVYSEPIRLHVTFSNPLYKRLAKYAKDRGVNEQESVRHFVSEMLEKMGY